MPDPAAPAAIIAGPAVILEAYITPPVGVRPPRPATTAHYLVHLALALRAITAWHRYAGYLGALEGFAAQFLRGLA
ncbi:MAG: hypothetical protein ACKO4A_15450, partial [Gammaproteobacteria bacterium]